MLRAAFNPAGGVRYHLRARRHRDHEWAPFRTAVDAWLAGWDPGDRDARHRRTERRPLLAELRGDARRLSLARLVLDHRLTARDPLARGDVAAETAIAGAWVEDTPLSLAEALALA